MKANGKLKSYLSGCTYGEAISRISQVAHDQDFTALKELQSCRHEHKRVGLRYANALRNSKIASMKYTYVVQTSSLCTTQFLVKQSDKSTVSCEVNLDTIVSWRGEQFRIVTGTCFYYSSTRIICPCACAMILIMCINFIVFGITHYGRRPSNLWNCPTTRIHLITLLHIWYLQAMSQSNFLQGMLPWTTPCIVLILRFLTK